MAGDFNSVAFTGRLTRDPELRYIERNDEARAVANFGLAVNRKGKDAPADFFEFSVWGKQAENLVEYKSKGDQILVRGEARYRTWEDKETGAKRSTVSFEVYEIMFLASKGDGGQRANGNNIAQASGGGRASVSGGSDDVDLNEDDFDDIPF